MPALRVACAAPAAEQPGDAERREHADRARPRDGHSARPASVDDGRARGRGDAGVGERRHRAGLVLIARS